MCNSAIAKLWHWAACGLAVKPPTLANVVGVSRHIVWMFETYHPDNDARGRQRRELLAEVAFRHVFRLQVMVRVLAANQRRPIPLTHGLLQPGRDIADRQTDAPVIGTIGFRSME